MSRLQDPTYCRARAVELRAAALVSLSPRNRQTLEYFAAYLDRLAGETEPANADYQALS